MRMLFTLLLTVLTATSGEDTHNSEGRGTVFEERKPTDTQQCVLWEVRERLHWSDYTEKSSVECSIFSLQ